MKHPEFHIPGAMKTTLNLRDDLVAEAKALAARERTTLTKIVEEGLALRLRGNGARMQGIWESSRYPPVAAAFGRESTPPATGRC